MTRRFGSTIALTVLAGCGGGYCGDVSVELDPDVPTKIDFAWEKKGEGRLEWGYDESYGTVVEAGSEDLHEASVLGAKQLREVFWKVVTTVGNNDKECEGTTDTLGAASSIADMFLDTYEPTEVSSEPYFIGAAMFDAATLFAIDRDASMVWFMPAEEDRLTTEITFKRGTNNPIYNVYADRYDTDLGTVKEITLGLDPVKETRIEWGHHFFTELPDGTITYTAIHAENVVPDGWSIDACDERFRIMEDGVEKCTVVGHDLVEVPPDGEPVILLSTFDVFDVVPWEDWDLNFYPQGQTWLHANAVNYDEERETYLWSFAGYDTVLEVDRTGSVVRSFGDFGDYKASMGGYARGEDGFNFQHDPHWTPDGNMLMFTYDHENGCYAIEFEIDDANKEMNEVWQFGRDEGLNVQALGQALRLENGNTFVNYGSTGILREVSPAGEVVWEAYTGSGTFFGNVYPFDSFYP